MSYPFDAEAGLVIVQAELTGPSGKAILRFALDTGATTTLVNAGMLVAIGYDPGVGQERVEVTTGSGVEYVPRIIVDSIVAIGKQRGAFPILAHTLPPSAGVDGLLGLDFFRGHTLIIDFLKAEITFAQRNDAGNGAAPRVRNE